MPDLNAILASTAATKGLDHYFELNPDAGEEYARINAKIGEFIQQAKNSTLNAEVFQDFLSTLPQDTDTNNTYKFKNHHIKELYKRAQKVWEVLKEHAE